MSGPQSTGTGRGRGIMAGSSVRARERGGSIQLFPLESRFGTQKNARKVFRASSGRGGEGRGTPSYPSSFFH